MSVSTHEAEVDIGEVVSVPATLPNLPNELLLLVIEHLDNDALLNLGLTCQRMNVIAFNHFFSANDIHNPGSGCFNPHGTTPPPVETLPILRRALFVTYLSYFDFALNIGIERMFSELSDIRALTTRLQSMDVFNCLPMHRWYRSVTSLLDAVLEKGCTELHVSAGTKFSTLYANHIAVQELPGLTQLQVNLNQGRIVVEKESRFARLRKQLGRIRFSGRRQNQKHSRHVGDNNDVIVNTAMGNAGKVRTMSIVDKANSSPVAPEFQPAFPSSREIRLAEVYIHSDMLLQHPFSQWTLLTLNAASSTITKLSLKLVMEASPTWNIFSASLALPLLQDFKFMNEFFSPPDVAAFVDVEDFLVNHPRITHLYLYGVGLPPSSKAVPRPSFQNLITFDAHPTYTVWLMNSLISSPAALPSLQRNYNHRITWDFDYSLFDSGLEAIATFPRSVVLALTFNCRSDVESWIRSHVRAGVEMTAVSRLVHTHTLSIYDSWSEYNAGMVAIIPDWLQLFPALKHLKFEREAQVNVAKLIEPQYVATISLLCQKLETMSVNRETFDLELVRKNLNSGADS
ncbi:hypothetical protein M413DRAFT_445302 [Hebeloma cylindrosporum]|uniref:F-box domain-containing protein n=1 Tax=Hebeloma cylindrosporum TaxID=76867 RepID=A0A0C3BXF4_HEBCY|nr:hypothetical protein M413DRAFT_445302 [Hebeloma cylindrosporum h7]